jgi:hypothetical protein
MTRKQGGSTLVLGTMADAWTNILDYIFNNDRKNHIHFLSPQNKHSIVRKRPFSLLLIRRRRRKKLRVSYGNKTTGYMHGCSHLLLRLGAVHRFCHLIRTDKKKTSVLLLSSRETVLA